jgi:hypothetical protein
VDLDPASEADYVLARDKVRRFADRGAGGILIAADDAEFDNGRPVDEALGRAHAAWLRRLVDDVRADHPGLPFWFVPTAYSTARADGVVDDAPSPLFPDGWGYLRALAALPADVRVLWTGPDTGNATLAAADLATPAETLGRKPALFDNFWANDGGDGFTARLWLAPLQGRDVDVPPAVGGYLQNPLIQGAIARWRIGTFAHWLCRASGRTDCGDAEDFAVAIETDLHPARSDRKEDAALLRLLPTVFDGHGAGRTLQDRTLEAAVDALAGELAAGAVPGAATVSALQDRLATLAGLASQARHSGLDPDLVDELDFPLQKTATLGNAGLAALALLFDRLSGRDEADAGARLDEAIAANALQRFDLSLGTPERLSAAVRDFRVMTPPRDDARLALPEPPACTVGAPWSWTPVPGADALSVSGLPGARVDGDTVRFLADHAGTYAGVAACLRAGSDGSARAFGFSALRVVCVEPGNR